MIPFNNTILNCRKMLPYKFHLIINQRNLPLIATEPCLCDDVCVCLCDDVCVCLCDDVWVCLCDDVCVCLCDDVSVCVCVTTILLKYHTFFFVPPFTSLHPYIGIHILHTVLCTFTKALTRRICLTIKHFLPEDHFFYSHDINMWFNSDIVRRN